MFLSVQFGYLKISKELEEPACQDKIFEEEGVKIEKKL